MGKVCEEDRKRLIQVEAEGEAEPGHPGLSGAVRAEQGWAGLCSQLQGFQQGVRMGGRGQ